MKYTLTEQERCDLIRLHGNRTEVRETVLYLKERGLKHCKGCHIFLDLGEFDPSRKAKNTTGTQHICWSCAAIHHHDYHKANWRCPVAVSDDTASGTPGGGGVMIARCTNAGRRRA
jgi:RNase P subunit RPR2